MAYLEYLPPVLALVVVVARLTLVRPRSRAAETKK
jgi:hypothetical protein